MPSDLVDTHCHLAHGRLRQQARDVLDRARAANVNRVICAAASVHDSKAALRLAEQFDGVYGMAGVHPHDAANAVGQYLTVLGDLCGRDKNVAVGEIGLDYHYDFSPREDQRRVFAEQLELANRLAKPIVIHTREAFEDTLAILNESGTRGERMVFHSFTGDAPQARRVLDLGATISFSGIATFKKSDELRASAALVPDERLLVETDAPFLSPEPVRKMKTNEPANVVHVARCLAGVRGTTPEEIARLTTANAERMFGLGSSEHASGEGS